MEKFEAEIYNPDDSLFVIKALEDVIKVWDLLEAMQSEVGDEGLVIWRPDE